MTSLSPSHVLEAAITYTRRGWRGVPLPHRSKKITTKGWQQWRLDEAELAGHFPAESNVGVLLGEPSGWLIDVDLDHPRAVELADQFLPRPTQASAGRASPGRTGSTSPPRRRRPESIAASRRA